MSGFDEITAFVPDAVGLPQAPISYDEYIRIAPFLDVCCLRDESDKRYLFDFINQIGEKALWSMQTQSIPKDTFPSVKPNPYVGTAAITVFNVTLGKVLDMDARIAEELVETCESVACDLRGRKRMLSESEDEGAWEGESRHPRKIQKVGSDGGEQSSDQGHRGADSSDSAIDGASYQASSESEHEYISAGHDGDNETAGESEIDEESRPSSFVAEWVGEIPSFESQGLDNEHEQTPPPVKG
jgi:hypothetical protein